MPAGGEWRARGPGRRDPRLLLGPSDPLTSDPSSARLRVRCQALLGLPKPFPPQCPAWGTRYPWNRWGERPPFPQQGKGPKASPGFTAAAAVTGALPAPKSRRRRQLDSVRQLRNNHVFFFFFPSGLYFEPRVLIFGYVIFFPSVLAPRMQAAGVSVIPVRRLWRPPRPDPPSARFRVRCQAHL